MNYYLYIDDIREDDAFYNHHFTNLWNVIICRDYYETIMTIDKLYKCGANIFVDLDHDLGFDDDNCEYNGYNICEYIVNNQIPLIGFHIHSMNPVGAQNMRNILNDYGVKEYI